MQESSFMWKQKWIFWRGGIIEAISICLRKRNPRNKQFEEVISELEASAFSKTNLFAKLDTNTLFDHEIREIMPPTLIGLHN